MDNDLLGTEKERIVEAAQKRERLDAFLAERGMDALRMARAKRDSSVEGSVLARKPR